MMTRLSRTDRWLINSLLWLFLLLPNVQAQCNTDQNPYCAGNDKLEALCCPYPNVCYWANRNGDPACCPAGQVCIDQGGNFITPQPIQTQPAQTTIYESPTQQLSTITSYVTSPNPTTPAGGGVVVITTGQPVCNACNTVTSVVGGAWNTVTSNVAGAWSTVTSDIVGGYETVTSTIGALATQGATDIVQVLNAAPARPDVSYGIGLVAGVGIALWQNG